MDKVTCRSFLIRKCAKKKSRQIMLLFLYVFTMIHRFLIGMIECNWIFFSSVAKPRNSFLFLNQFGNLTCLMFERTSKESINLRFFSNLFQGSENKFFFHTYFHGVGCMELNWVLFEFELL